MNRLDLTEQQVNDCSAEQPLVGEGMSNEKAERQYFDIALVIPLEEELIQVMDQFTEVAR